jgi:hypothetical protein
LLPPSAPACLCPPRAKDCEDCIINSTLQYSRTGPKPYYHGYKGGEYSVPMSTWPVCIGKCAAGKCEINPVAATCCREDEEAYPLEDEYEEYHRDDMQEYQERDDDYYERVGVTARTQARAQSDESDGKPKPKTTVKKSANGKKYRKRYSTTKHTTSKYGKDSDKYSAKDGKDSEKHYDGSKYGKESEKHYSESKYRKHAVKEYEPKEKEDEYFSGKHSAKKEPKPEPKKEEDEYFSGKHSAKKETKPEPKKEEPKKHDKEDETIVKGDKPYEYKYKPGRKDTPKSDEDKHKEEDEKQDKEEEPKKVVKKEEPEKEDEKPSKDDDGDFFGGKEDFFGGKHDGKSGDDRRPSPDYFGEQHGHANEMAGVRLNYSMQKAM